MTKRDIATAITERTGSSVPNNEAVINAFTETVRDALADGRRVDFRMFGSFRNVTRKAKAVQNMHTHQALTHPEWVEPVFKPAPVFKQQVKVGKDVTI